MKEYSIKLRLTATEAEKLVKAAAHHDQKVSELLESFVYDLVSSDEHRGGDDETAAAHQCIRDAMRRYTRIIRPR